MTAPTTSLTPMLNLDPRYAEPADDARLRSAARALEANGFTVLIAQDGAEARRLVLDLLPDGAEVHQGASETLDRIGVTEEIATSGRFDALRPRLWSMDRATQARDMRKLGAGPDYMLGSAHAVTEDGALVIASKTGSQLGPYAFGAGNVIWVVGAQKIVPDLADAFRRLERYSLPLEEERSRKAFGVGSAINKVLVVKGEIQPGRGTVILVREAIGA